MAGADEVVSCVKLLAAPPAELIEHIPWVKLPAAPPAVFPTNIERLEHPGPFAALPAELLQRIFAMLPHHEHSVHALMTCRSWHAVAQDRMLWASYAARLGLVEGARIWYHGHKLTDHTARQWRDMAAERALRVACYQCGHPTHWRTIAGPSFRPILCAICIDNYQLGRESHRLLSTTEAMFRYKLRVADLGPLPHAAVENPVNSNFTSMHLFRRPDLVRAAIKRWGGVASMWKQMRKYRDAGLDAPPCSVLVKQEEGGDATGWIPVTVVSSWDGDEAKA